MTDPRDPDDLASALLDGLLSDDEAAVARRDPAVAARLAELATVREMVGRPPHAPDPAVRERTLAAALAAYDSPDEAGQPGGTAVGPRRGARAAPGAAPGRRGIAWRRLGSAHRRWLTAAAVVLVVVGVGMLASNWDTGDGDDSATAARESSSEGDESGSAANAGGGTSTSPPAGDGMQLAIVDLGDVDSPEALAERAQVVLAGRSSDAAAAPGDEAESEEGQSAADARPAACADDAQAERLAAGGEPVVLRGRATLAGQPVDVWVVGAGGDQRVVAVDASCAVVVDQSLRD
jgi:hypothetical protein